MVAERLSTSLTKMAVERYVEYFLVSTAISPVRELRFKCLTSIWLVFDNDHPTSNRLTHQSSKQL